MKPGRNEPCPCGSGKKYKQCCLIKQAEAAQAPEQLAWRRVRRVVDEFGSAAFKFIIDVYGETAVLEAWAEFVADREDERDFDPETPHATVFFSWLLYRWAPDPYETEVADVSLHDVVPAREYLQRKGKRIDPLLRSEFADSILYPKLPELRNTDGDVLAPQALIYDIDSAEDAFVALHDLEFKATQAELREEAELDDAGRIVRCEITWQGAGNAVHKTWDNTTLGSIVVSAKRLRAEVNSDQRAEKLRGIIQARLGAAARYRVTERQSMQRMLAESAGAASSAALAAEQDELMQLPEVQAHLHQMLAAHYEGWVHEALPALRGQTPLQAVTTAEGRERVAILVDDIERLSTKQTGFDAAIIKRLREQLGLV